MSDLLPSPPAGVDLPIEALLLDHVQAAVVVTDLDGRITMWNPRAEALYGWTAQEAIGRSILETTVDTRETPDALRIMDDIRAGRVFEGEFPVRRKDGSRFLAFVTLGPIPGPDGSPLAMVGASVDVTVRYLAERRLTTQYAVTRALADAATLEEAAPAALEAICRALDWELGGLWALDQEADELAPVAFWHEPSRRLAGFVTASRSCRFPRGVGLPGRVWRSGTSTWVQDVTVDDNFPRAPAAVDAGLHGALAFPILLHGEVLGVLEFFSPEVREPDEEQAEMVAAVGSQIGQFMERMEAEAATRESGARSAAMLESALDCVVAIDHRGLITDWNQAAESTFGYARDEVIGRRMAELIVPPSLRERHEAAFTRYLETGEPRILGQRLEITGMRKDGTEFPVELAVTRIGTSEPPAFTAYLRDIADRNREREAAARLASIVETSADAIFSTTGDGTVLTWNPGAERTYGFTGEEIVGRSVDLIVPERHRKDMRDSLSAIMSGLPVARRETERMRKDGTIIQVERTFAPIHDTEGRVVAVSTLVRDITARKRAESRLRLLAEAGRLLTASLEYRRTLASIAALAVPDLAEWCLVYMQERDGSIRRLAMAHAPDGARRDGRSGEDVAEEIEDRFTIDGDATTGVPQVIRTGRSVLLEDATAKDLASDVDDPEGQARLLEPLGIRSWMCAPLTARGRTIGAISFVSTTPERSYGPEDLAMAEEVARQAALAVDNALLFEAEQEARRWAEEAARRTALMYTLTASLAESVTAEMVAETVVQRVVPALGARAGLLAMLTDDGGSLEVVRAAGYADDVVRTWQRFPVDQPLPLSEAVRTGEPVFIESQADRDARYPVFAGLPMENESVACVPLIVEDRAVGGITLSFRERHALTEEDRALLNAVARQTAQALERARLYQAERTARDDAEEARDRLELLAEAGDVLARSLAYEETLVELTGLAVPRMADWCIVDLLQSDGTVEQVAAAHVDPEKTALARELRERFPPDWASDTHPIPRVLHTGRPEFAPEVSPEGVADTERDPGNIEILRELGIASHIVVPLVARGRTLGAVSFVYGQSGRHYGHDDLALAEELAGRAALAIDNSRLYESEQRGRETAVSAAHAERAARAEAEEARARLAFLAEASEALARSLDYRRTLVEVARLAVPTMADWCGVDMVEDGEIKQVAVAHVDPEKVKLARQLRRKFPPDPAARTGVPHVLRTGKPELLPEVPDSLLEEIPQASLRRLVRELQIHSVMIVPMTTGGRTAGTISFVWAESARTYGAADLALAQDLARRAAQAIENARLYQERDHIARTLQQSLLPPELPEVDRIELAARYVPAGAGTEVGGDFYDVFPTGDGSWGLAVGDVCGKGPDAAAVMGVARYTLRAAAMSERRPSSLLATLNEAVRRQIAEGRFLTVCYVRIRPGKDDMRLTVCCAGHPLPWLLRADGTLEPAGQPGTLLGIFPDPELIDVRVDLAPGDALVLYTDGVSEAAGADPLAGEQRLAEVVQGAAGLDADGIVERIERHVLRRRRSPRRDDMALLAMRVRP